MSEASRTRSAFNATESPDALGRRVLVVDDSRAHRLLLCRTLERWGYRTVEAESGEEALNLCRDEISLIISDWMMPGMSGIEFCREFRRSYLDRPSYFILLTAQTERNALAEGLENGADDFLSKPFQAVELKARIRAGERMVEARESLAQKNKEISTALDQLTRAYAEIDRDLRQARAFQASLVPEKCIELDGGTLTFLYRPSGHVGGDLVGYFPVGERRYGLFSVDVSGHGVASALMTARVAALFSAASLDQNIALRRGPSGKIEMLPPELVCERLNSILLRDGETDLYLTMALADLDVDAMTVRFGIAGHPSPLILRGKESEKVQVSGMPIGLVNDAPFGAFATKLARGDSVFFYSDGIIECPSPEGELFEETRLMETLRKPDRDTEGIMTELEDSLCSFAGNTALPDDLSALMFSLQ